MTDLADDRVDVKALAALLHCRPSTARRLMGDVIPATRVGGRWTARRVDVNNYLASKTIVGRPRKGRGKAVSGTATR